jgi:hypothetical protein
MPMRWSVGFVGFVGFLSVQIFLFGLIWLESEEAAIEENDF